MSTPSNFARILRAPGRSWRAVRAVRRILDRLGYWRTVRSQNAVDGLGEEVPWFTYPAFEFLEQLDFRGKTVFEFGAGHSTLYWSRRALRVVSIESDPDWHERLRPRVPENVELALVEGGPDYAGALGARSESFDVIVVDGIERRACCGPAIAKLRPGGMIILDNSDWHHRCAALLRESGLLEVDFSGFGPINDYTWTTSLFLHRQFDFPRRRDRQPTHGIGALPHLEQP
jgi:hypothetical protein